MQALKMIRNKKIAWSPAVLSFPKKICVFFNQKKVEICGFSF
jgi:hypothetical protein